MINEAFSLEKKMSSGYSHGEVLNMIYQDVGEGEFNKKNIPTVLGVMPYNKFFIHKNRLVINGYIEAVNRKAKLTQAGLDYVNGVENGAEPTPKVAKGVQDITKLKQKKFKVPKVGNNSKYLEQMKTILSHMVGSARGVTKTTYMLAGDPGTGKTSFIRSLSILTGIPLVVIEAPHITQEHLINIPFLVIDGNKEKKGNVQYDEREMKVVQSESNLVTQLKNKVQKSPEEIQRFIDKNKVLRDIQPQLQARLNQLTGSYNSILFLDEFYRTSSLKIRNVLRNILNGKIGNDKIPKGVYIIMATNINDDGVEDIPLNQDFHVMDYDISSKEDFMTFMYGKYVETEGDGADEDDSNMNIDVWNAFMNNLTDKELGFNDEGVDVRLSPRRLEQIIIGVNSMMPIVDENQAALLYSFIKTNLSNYLEEEASQVLLDKFNTIIDQIIKESNPDLFNEDLKNNLVPKSDWRNQLQSQLEMKMKLGDSRSYVPVVSGMPGIGKTTHYSQAASNLDMGFIQVDTSNLTVEDLTGIPIASTGPDGEITTKFSEPNLYITIMKEYNAIIDDVRQEGRKYNVVLLLDELNRASTPVFNGIRKVLLEKEFESIKLPADIIMTGAINPHDIGAAEFTSHTRDVLDIIPSAGHFDNTLSYINGRQELINLNDDLGFNVTEAVTSVLRDIASGFRSEVNGEGEQIEDVNEQMFFWDTGFSVLYVSPREMTEMSSNAVLQIWDRLIMDEGFDVNESYDEETYDRFIDVCLAVTANKFVETLKMGTLKQDADEDFLPGVASRITNNDRVRQMFEVIRTKKNANIMSMKQILDQYNGEVDMLDRSILGSYIQDFTSSEIALDINDIIQPWNGMDGMRRIAELNNKLAETFTELNASNEVMDQMNKITKGKLASIMKNDVNVLDVMADKALMNNLRGML